MDVVRENFKAAWSCARRLLVVVPLLAPGHGVKAQDIILGQTLSTTNPLVSAISREYNAGIQLALDRANATGGVRGRPLRLVVRDDDFDARKTVNLVEELVEQGAVALVGVMGTQPTLKLADDKVLEKHHLAVFGPMTGLQAALSRPNVFPVRGSYEDEVRAMLAHSARLSRGNVLYLYYEAGVGPQLAKLLPGMARETGVSLAGVAGFPVTADKRLQEAAVAKAIDGVALRPDAVVLLAIGPVHSEAVKALRKRYGLGMPVYSLGQVNSAALIQDVGADQARGVMLSQVMPMPGGVKPEVVRDFETDRKRFSGSLVPSYSFLEGYICGRITIEVLKRAKALTREGVLQAAGQAGQIDVGGFRVQYDPDSRRSINPVELTMLSRTGVLIR